MRQLLRGPLPSSAHACASLDEWLATKPGIRTVSIYSPLSGEIDLAKIIRSRPDIRWVYPRIHEDGVTLTLHEGGDLESGAFGIMEPRRDSPEVAAVDVDLFVCPGLAFAEDGGRLGRGRGFYDRLLAKARPGAFKVGICHGFQMIPETFGEDHDIRMDAVIF